MQRSSLLSAGLENKCKQVEVSLYLKRMEDGTKQEKVPVLIQANYCDSCSLIQLQ